MNDRVKLSHGDGGFHTRELIRELFKPCFDNELLHIDRDSAVFSLPEGKTAFTTDSFVVKPVFFSGGNIGKLAACGTINDLVVSGAIPLYISAGFILEEGFAIADLQKIVGSMSEICNQAGVRLVTGDTKVVEKGSVDGIYINTSGIGSLLAGYTVKPLEAGDSIIITGGIGEHGTTIALERYGIKIHGELISDCGSLACFLPVIKQFEASIKIMRDPTRGGLAATLKEFLEGSSLSVCLMEEQIPVSDGVKAVKQLLGLEPLCMACEGRMVLGVRSEAAEEILQALKTCEPGKDSKIIGKFIKNDQNLILSTNYFGGKRIIEPMESAIFPRIC